MTRETLYRKDLEFVDGQWVMDSRTIAELMGKDHRHVLRDIEKQMSALAGGLPNSGHTPSDGLRTFSHTYRNEQNGQEYRCFKLPRRECLILMAGYNVILRAKIIDRWEALETGKAIPAFVPAIRTFKLPSGAQLRELRLACEKRVIDRKEFLKAIGLGDAPPPATVSPVPVALAHTSPETIKELEAVVTELKTKAAKAGATAFSRTLEKGSAKVVQLLIQPTLGLEAPRRRS